MAALMLCSNSTIVSFGQSFLRISSRLTTSPACSSSMARIRKGCSGRRTGFAPSLHFAAAKVEFKGCETDSPLGGVKCHCLPLDCLKVYHGAGYGVFLTGLDALTAQSDTIGPR